MTLLFLGAAGTFYTSPYVSTAKFRSAVELRGRDRFEAVVDFHSIQNAMEKRALLGMPARRAKLRPLWDKGSRVGHDEVQAADFSTYTFGPEGFSRWARERQAAVKEPYQIVSRGWRSPVQFVVRDNFDQAAKVFTFHFTGWKLTDIEYNEADIAALLGGRWPE